MKNEIYPCTIVNDRYNGIYSGGKWTAWNLDAENVPSEINGGDMACLNFWEVESECYIIGRGNTIIEAYKNLYERLY